MTFQLIGISGDNKGRVWDLDRQGLLAGRGGNCDVVIPDPAVSRQHCRIALTDGVVRLEDLGSRHPVLVNGLPLKAGTLRPKDEVAIGTEVFLIGVAGELSPEQTGASRPPRTAPWDHARIQRKPGATPDPESAARPHSVDDLVTLQEVARAFGRARTVHGLLTCFSGYLVERFHPQAHWIARTHEGRALTFCSTLDGRGDPAQDAPRETMDACLERGEGLLAPRTRQIDGETVNTIVLAAPVLFDDYLLGVTAVEARPPVVYTEADLHLLMLFTANLAPYIYAVETVERMRRDLEQLRAGTGDSLEIVGQSRAIMHLRGEIAKASHSPLHVLISGESGSGKELVARNVHAASDRRAMPLVVMNCAAIPRDLVESQLFGHIKGAFTGADETRRGLLAQAHGGTLFLDEVGDLSLENQARILRVIESGAYLPVGGECESYVDLRVIAATNKDLSEAVKAGAFRKDLYYRLNGYEISVPSLRERPSDIPLLAAHFFELGKQHAKRPLLGITAAAMDYLYRRAWPGNVRELRNVVTRGVSVAEGPELELQDVMLEYVTAPEAAESSGSLSLAEAMKRHIAGALRLCRGDVNAAASLLDISRSALYRKIAEFGLDRHG